MRRLIFFSLLFFIVSCGGGAGGTSVFDVPELPQKSDVRSTSLENTNSVFVGYDDSGSTAIAQLLKYQIENDLVVSKELALPHELLNAETFTSTEMSSVGTFEISAGLLKSVSKESGKVLYNLGVNLRGPVVENIDRPNLVLTYLIDVSGSMNSNTGSTSLSSKTKMNLIKDGLVSSAGQFKIGDVVNIVLFSSKATVLVSNYKYGESSEAEFLAKIKSISASSATNLDEGLVKAYELATQTYDVEKKNRILLITDAFINEGTIDASLIAQNVILNNKEGILLSSLGVGFDYQAGFLEELSNAGSGNQFLVATDADAERIFSEDFFPLLMLAAKNLKVEIEFPVVLSHISSAAEQVASSAAEIKGVNFSFNASQFYLERFKTNASQDVLNQSISIHLSYVDPITAEATSATKTFLISDLISKEHSNIKDALSIVYLTNLIDESKAWEDMEWEFSHVLKDHASKLYDAYKKLIYRTAGKELDLNDSF